MRLTYLSTSVAPSPPHALRIQHSLPRIPATNLSILYPPRTCPKYLYLRIFDPASRTDRCIIVAPMRHAPPMNWCNSFKNSESSRPLCNSRGLAPQARYLRQCPVKVAERRSNVTLPYQKLLASHWSYLNKPRRDKEGRTEGRWTRMRLVIRLGL